MRDGRLSRVYLDREGCRDSLQSAPWGPRRRHESGLLLFAGRHRAHPRPRGSGASDSDVSSGASQPSAKPPARARRRAVDQRGAGPALAKPATKLRPIQLEIVARDIKERRVGGGIDLAGLAIDGQTDFRLRRVAVSGPQACTASMPGEYRLCTDVQAHVAPHAFARFMNSRPGQMSYYSAAARFRRPRCLTGFRS